MDLMTNCEVNSSSSNKTDMHEKGRLKEILAFLLFFGGSSVQAAAQATSTAQPPLIATSFSSAEGWTTDLVLKVLFTQWVLKVSWEVILTPVTYVVVGWLKRREGIDVYDEATDFTPFRAKL